MGNHERKVIDLLTNLGKILKNLKKAPSRKYLKITLLNKEKLSKELYEEILFLTDDFDIHQQKIYITEARNIYGQIKIILHTKLELDLKIISFKGVAKAILFAKKLEIFYKKSKMASVLEIIKVTSSLVPTFDGNSNKLEATLSALRALDTIVTNDTRPTAINVVLSKLEGRARSAVGDAPATISVIIQKLTDRCKTSTSPDVIVAKLNATRQTGTLSAFTDEVEKITTLLETAYLAENIPMETAGKMATKAGVKALSNGVKNPQTQLILKAGTFETLNAAIGKAAENEPSTSVNQNAQIMYVSGPGNRGRGQHANYGSRHHNNRGHGRFSTRGGFQNNRGRGNSNHYNNQRGRGSQNNYQRGGPQTRVYYTHQQQPQNNPQQQQTQQQTPQVQQQMQQQNTQQPNFLGQIQSYTQ